MVSGVRTCIGLLIMLISLGFSPIATASACGQEYVCREALVKFSKHLDLQGVQITLMEADAEVLQYFEGSRVYHIHFLNNEGTLKQIVSLWEQPYVLMVSPNWRVSAHTLPDDPDFGNLWGLRSVDNQGNDLGIDIRMEEVWGQLTLGSEVIVAVIDSGIDYEHEDLADNMWVNSLEANGTPGVDDDGNGYVDDVHGYDFMNNDGDPMDDHKHGTHVAGTIGAVGNNGIGVTGVTWSTNVKLMAIKFLNSAATGNLSDAMAGMEYAVTNGATILNNSWGSGVFDMALKNAIFSSDEQGAIFFAAAGNQSRNTDQLPFYPASYDVPNIVSVGATTELDKLWNGSNYGNLSVDFAAPGASVYSTFPNDSYGYLTGTSMATPHAAGAAALLWSQFPELSHRQIINLLLQGTQAKVYLEGKTRMGGILNVANSLAIANNPDNHPPVANAGSDNTLPLGVIINLQGAASDEDGDFPLTFEWSLTPPEGSNTQLNDPFSQSPSFIPDQEGDYVLMLVVHDSLSSSVPDSITITIEGGGHIATSSGLGSRGSGSPKWSNGGLKLRGHR